MPPLYTMTKSLLDPATIAGSVCIGLLVFIVTFALATFLRRSARRLEQRLSNVTMLQFASVFAQLLVYLLGLALYAHLIPELRTVGTALLAGAGVLSIVVGLAAQDTLGNLIAGFSLVLSRALAVGDNVKVYTPVGIISARVEAISLGFTSLRDEDSNEVVVPNGVLMNGAIVRIVGRTRRNSPGGQPVASESTPHLPTGS